MAKPIVIEGTWEEIVNRAGEFAGRRVRLEVVEPPPTPPQPWSTGASLLQYAGTWEGDDLEDCLRIVTASRSLAWFGLGHDDP